MNGADQPNKHLPSLHSTQPSVESFVSSAPPTNYQGIAAHHLTINVIARLLLFLAIGALFIRPSFIILFYDWILSTVPSSLPFSPFLSTIFLRRLDFLVIITTSVIILPLGIIVSTRNALVSLNNKPSSLNALGTKPHRTLIIFVPSLFLLLLIANFRSFLAPFYEPAFRLDSVALPSSLTQTILIYLAGSLLAVTLATLLGAVIFYLALRHYSSLLTNTTPSHPKATVSPTPSASVDKVQSLSLAASSPPPPPRQRRLHRTRFTVLGTALILVTMVIFGRLLFTLSELYLIGTIERPTEYCPAEQVFTSLTKAMKNKRRVCALKTNSFTLTSLPSKISELEQLKELHLTGFDDPFTSSSSCHKIASLPPAIGQLSQLQALYIGCGPLTSLPEEIGQLKQLKRLGISGHKLTALPVSLGDLPQLESLVINKHALSALPSSIGRLRNLSEVKITEGSKLRTIPASIGQLENLTTLRLGTNQLNSLPPTIGQLKNLADLDVYGNHLTDLPASIGQLEKLTKLSVKGNKLTTLPPTIGQLSNLSRLDASANLISYLPAEFNQLTQLKHLNLNYNRLTAFPPPLLDLLALEYLFIDRNQITSIPPAIANLTNLRSVHFDQANLPAAEQQRLSDSLPNTRFGF